MDVDRRSERPSTITTSTFFALDDQSLAIRLLFQCYVPVVRRALDRQVLQPMRCIARHEWLRQLRRRTGGGRAFLQRVRCWRAGCGAGHRERVSVERISVKRISVKRISVKRISVKRG